MRAVPEPASRRSVPPIIVPLGSEHDRATFDCGVSSLNEFLRRYARQNEERGLSRTFVAVADAAPASGKSVPILGYYTLSGGAVRAAQMPQEKLPRYPVPTAHLGRLAVDRRHRGQGIGEYLLLDALRRCLEASREIGLFAVEVVALDEAARRFYEKYGFVGLADDPLHLYLPMKTIEALGLDKVE